MFSPLGFIWDCWDGGGVDIVVNWKLLEVPGDGEIPLLIFDEDILLSVFLSLVLADPSLGDLDLESVPGFPLDIYIYLFHNY